jgi:hypothetical protein
MRAVSRDSYDPSIEETEYIGTMALIIAVMSKSLPVLTYKADSGSLLSSINCAGRNLLYLALYFANFEIFHFLLLLDLADTCVGVENKAEDKEYV